MEVLMQQLINGLTIGNFYALLALGYTMVFGIMRLINFAHGDVYMVGSFLGLSILGLVGTISTPGVGTFVMAMLASMLITGLIGMLINRVAYVPLLNAPRLSIMISALAVSLLLENLVMVSYGPSFQVYPHLFNGNGLPISIVKVSYTQIGMVFISIILMIALQLFIKKTFVGKAMRAVSLDQDAAQLMGINVRGIVALTFFIGSALASAAGVMMGGYYGQISFMMGFLMGLKAFTAAVLGGIGNIPGAVLGGFLLGILETLGGGYFSPAWKDVFAFGILILVLVFKPTGLLGEPQAEKM
ncbi:branched-chain amino acid ABC transporter permease [Aneurinibacillus tyrosinisolvens]|uniref:branched-chain amino acid ABC transporter permease n=1 Tax=Aneurinibacillus tyrosinisolvens TaxID=1443435 RepID=UPI000AE6ABED|nr:branched-chain amino acid ABC transporter permease [Aneurinibacillus tyrosinisolvens]